MNVVTLIGNLSEPPTVTTVPDGSKVATFEIGLSRPEEEGGTDRVKVVCVGSLADLVSDYLGKGRRVAIDGRLRSNEFNGDVYVVARRVEFLQTFAGTAT